ncbi:MAG: DNA recombination protein RmuC [Acidimicrobiia bacterium]|nr:DNA recombination protein RmuC [Acidimicrobiia bacterium]
MIYAVVLIGIIAVVLGVAVGWLLASRAAEHTVTRVSTQMSAEAVDLLRRQHGENLQATVDTVISVASSKLGDQLEAGRTVIGREHEAVAAKVSNVESELRRVGELVSSLQKERAEQTGRLSTGLQQALQVTTALNETTRSLREALASPRARGQWGERMAEDVLRAAGFLEGTSYLKQTKLASGGVPDYTFPLPTGHVVHMDVKFPIDNYLRWLEADDTDQRRQLARTFQRDVRQRIKELTDRAYIDPETTVDYLLLFVPNESVYGFVHEHDPDLIDYSLSNRVILCSPTTLFAVLAVIRQAIDNFRIDQRSHEILAALGALREQFDRWEEPMEKMRRGLISAQRAFDDLSGPRARQFERQLDKLESFRHDVEAGQPSRLRQVV